MLSIGTLQGLELQWILGLLQVFATVGIDL